MSNPGSSEFAAFLCEFPRSEDDPGREMNSVLSIVNTKSGARLWTRQGAIPPTLAIADNRLFAIDGASVVALDLKSGKALWKLKQSRPMQLGTGEGALIVPQAGGATSIQPETGKELWTSKLSSDPRAAPVIGAGTVFITILESSTRGFVGALAAVSVNEVKALWLKEFPKEDAFSPAFFTDDGVGVYTMGDDPAPDGLRLFSMSGEPRWTAPLRSDANGHDFRPALQGNSIFDWTQNEKSKSGNEYQTGKGRREDGRGAVALARVGR